MKGTQKADLHCILNTQAAPSAEHNSCITFPRTVTQEFGYYFFKNPTAELQ